MGTDKQDQSTDLEQYQEAYATAFDKDPDPLKQYSAAFEKLPDPFDYFIQQVLVNDENIRSEDTIEDYERTYRYWRKHMSETNRHFACPKPQHVQDFLEWRQDVHNNSRSTVVARLRHLKRAYAYWQDTSILPHPDDYNPFNLGQKQTELSKTPKKEFPNITLQELQSKFNEITNIRNRAIIGHQIKLGTRRSAVSNCQIPDVDINHQQLKKIYPELGTHPAIEDLTNVIYIPSKYEREGNKSANPRILPLDEELKWLLLRYLLSRATVDEPWLFLSNNTYSQLVPRSINRIWNEAFRSESGDTKFDESNDTRAVTSHFGRHWFSSHWRLNANLEREQVQYMRGDRIEPIEDFAEAIDEYLHPHYNDIKEEYRSKVYKLDIPMRHYTD